MPWLDGLYALFIQAIWGLNSPVIKFGLHELPAIGLLLLRFTITVVLLAPFFRKFPKEQLWPLVRLGLLSYGGNYVCAFSALKYLEASTFLIILQLQIFIAMAIGHVLFKEHIPKYKIIGCVIALIGIVIIFGLPKLHGADPVLGVLLTLAAAVFYALTNIEMKRLKGVTFVTYNFVPIAVALPWYVFLLLITEPSGFGVFATADPFTVSWVLLYQIAMGMVAAFGWQQLIVKHGIAAVTPWMLTMPLFGIAGSVLFLHESLSLVQIIGSALVIGGVAVAQLWSRFAKTSLG